jgi:hypothetical protein
MTQIKLFSEKTPEMKEFEKRINEFLKVHDPRCGNETQRTDAFAAMPQT